MKLPLLPKPEPRPKQKTARQVYEAHFMTCLSLPCGTCDTLAAAANFEREEAMRVQEAR